MTTSLKIAEVFEKQHKDILEKIRLLAAEISATKLEGSEFGLSLKKLLIRSTVVPDGLSLFEQANLWSFLNEMLCGSGELVLLHDKRLFYFVASRERKKFRYRACAQAKKRSWLKERFK